MKYRHNLLRLSVLILFALLLRADTLSGQNYFAFTPNGLSGWPDSIPRGDTVTVGGWLKNYSSTVFQDSLYIQGTVDTGAGPIPFTFDFSYLVALSFNIPVNDSAFMLLPFVFDTNSSVGPQFHVGNNVVVVWPISAGPGSFLPGDSLELNVFVIDTLQSIGPDPENDVRIYPVPANGPLYINSIHTIHRVESVIVYDAFGQIMFRSLPNTTASPINTEAWAPGLYLIETTLSNGAVSYFKILRQ